MKRKIFPIIKRNRFFNPCGGCEPESLLFGTVPSFIKSVLSRFKRPIQDVHAWIHTGWSKPESDQLQITWIGHATFLIQGDGINIITDPVFGNVSSVFRRLLPPGIMLENLPRIDYILISHNHYDHMDAPSLHAIKERNPHVRVLVPQGDKKWFDYYNYNSHEHSWWDTHENRFHFLPTVHWSRRGIFDTNKSLWGSWMIQLNNKQIYFAGDTAYGNHFCEIADSFEVDVALLPIGPCEPHEWMKHSHMSGSQSLQAFNDLGATHFFPMHWGTFPFGNDQFDAPIKQMHQLWQTHQLNNKQLHIAKAGQPITFEVINELSELPCGAQEVKEPG